jgi:hypothetical protein
MEIDVGPIASGVAGAILAGWVCAALARWVPAVCNGKDAKTLRRENRTAIYLSNGCFLAGLLAAVLVYKSGIATVHDWRPLAVGFGAGAVAPVAILPASAALAGREPREALVAYAVSQMMPPALLYAVFALGSACLAAGIVGLAGL